MTLDSEGLHKIANTDRPHLRADIVFVHGLGGSSHNTWRCSREGTDDHFFWPIEMGKALSDCAIWSLGAPSGKGHWFSDEGMALEDRAKSLFLKLNNAGLGRRPLIFIAHSMGGLVVKEFVTEADGVGGEDWLTIANQVCGIVFLGTPHHGSRMASVAKGFAVLLRTQEHVKQMKFAGPALGELHKRFKKWHVRTVCPIESYVETRGIARNGKLARLLPSVSVVPRISGDPDLGPEYPCYPVSADHITLAKPSSNEHDVYAGVLRFIKKALQLAATRAAANPATVSSSAQSSQAKSDIGRPQRRCLFVHHYSLLDNQRGLIGRRSWTDELDGWIIGDSQPTIVVLHAIGGAGKSALTWKWFNSLCERQINTEIAGGLWYCFYEPGASFKDFLRRVYDYVLGPAHAEASTEQTDGTTQLLERLRDERFVFVLDGFERILKAYGREQTAHGRTADLATNAELIKRRERDLCLAIDENATAFLIAMSKQMRTRLLLTSRLIPTALLNIAGKDRPFVRTLSLDSLSKEEVVDMLAAYGVRGKKDTVGRVTDRFGRHALLVKLIAGMVANDPQHSGDFDNWLNAHPAFEPTQMNVTENRVHVLDYSLQQLSPLEQSVLLHAAAFRTAVSFENLEHLICGKTPDNLSKDTLGDALSKLDSLNLIEWDRRQKTYDLHPLVRNTVSLRASVSSRQEVDDRVIQEFKAFPSSDWSTDPAKIERQKDVFFAYVRRERYEDAWRLYQSVFSESALFRAGNIDLVIELLLTLILGRPAGCVPLYERVDRSQFFLELGLALTRAGRQADTLGLMESHRTLCPESFCQAHQAKIMRSAGALISSEHILRRLVSLARDNGNIRDEAAVLPHLAWSQENRGLDVCGPALRRLSKLWRELSHVDPEDVKGSIRHILHLRCKQCMAAHRAGKPGALVKAERLALRALRIAMSIKDTTLQINALFELWEVAFVKGDLDVALDYARQSCEIAQRAGLYGSHLAALVIGAKTDLKLGRLTGLAERLSDAAEMSEQNGDLGRKSAVRYLQALLAKKIGDVEIAAVHAKEAYRVAWCDGPPFAIAEPLREAESLLRELGLPLSTDLIRRELPPDWVEVELNPTEFPRIQTEDRHRKRRWEEVTPEGAARMLYVPSEDDNSQGSEVEYYLRRSDECFDSGEYDEAIAWADLAIEHDPWGHDCHTIRGKARWHTGLLEDALEDYDKAIHIRQVAAKSPMPLMLSARGQIYALIGRAPDALRDLERVLTDEPEDADAWNGKALALAVLGHHEESDEAFDRAITLGGETSLGWFYRGRALTVRGCRERASEAFEKSLALDNPALPPWMRIEANR